MNDRHGLSWMYIAHLRVYIAFISNSIRKYKPISATFRHRIITLFSAVRALPIIAKSNIQRTICSRVGKGWYFHRYFICSCPIGGGDWRCNVCVLIVWHIHIVCALNTFIECARETRVWKINSNHKTWARWLTVRHLQALGKVASICHIFCFFNRYLRYAQLIILCRIQVDACDASNVGLFRVFKSVPTPKIWIQMCKAMTESKMEMSSTIGRRWTVLRLFYTNPSNWKLRCTTEHGMCR